MPASASTSMLRLASIDDYLGAGDSRFFGSGYRKVRYRLEGIVTSSDDRSGSRRIQATAGVAYPTDWSRKSAEVALRPHLSTIDALILAARLSDLALSEAYHLTEQQRRRSWLGRVDIKAGSAPVEDNLDNISVEVSGPEATVMSDASGDYVSTFLCCIGNMKVRCEIEHPIGSAGRGAVEVGDRELYQEGYRHQLQRIDDITVDMRDQRADAVVVVEGAEGAGAPGEVVESVSIIDAFVVSLQLGQVLLYGLDEIPRAESNTLWMRRTTITAATPRRPVVGPFTVQTSLAESRILESRGTVWRAATIVGECQGIDVRCAVAHQLPISIRPGVTA